MAAAIDEAHHVIRPRRVRFDWSSTPLHWVPGDAHTTHVANVLHLLLPAGERFFVDVFRDAVPLVKDDQLRAEVKAFMGQEATHARAHSGVLERHLASHAIDTSRFTFFVQWIFNLVLQVRPVPQWLPRRVRSYLDLFLLRWQLAFIAAIEHFTAVLGWWIVVAPGLERAGADPTMLDLLRWHGAEEVEHRSVAFDLAQHLRVGYFRRVTTMIGTVLGLVGMWYLGTRSLMRRDPTFAGGKAKFREYFRAAREGKLPRAADIVRAVPRYLRPRYHPSQEGRTQVALDYLAVSPAALGASAPAAASAA